MSSCMILVHQEDFGNAEYFCCRLLLYIFLSPSWLQIVFSKTINRKRMINEDGGRREAKCPYGWITFALTFSPRQQVSSFATSNNCRRNRQQNHTQNPNHDPERKTVNLKTKSPSSPFLFAVSVCFFSIFFCFYSVCGHRGPPGPFDGTVLEKKHKLRLGLKLAQKKTK